jgi:hypothetical protein
MSKESACRASRKYKQNHKAQAYLAEKKWREKNPDRWRLLRKRHILKKRYGLTFKSLEELRLAQENLCPICDKELKTDRSTHIDHDHITGRVRGLLHAQCNRIVGYVENQRNKIDKALKYLEV